MPKEKQTYGERGWDVGLGRVWDWGNWDWGILGIGE